MNHPRTALPASIFETPPREEEQRLREAAEQRLALALAELERLRGG